MALHGASPSAIPALSGIERIQRFLLARPRGLRVVIGVALATLVTAVAALVQSLVLPQLTISRFLFFYTGVAVVAWLAGRAAGMLTVVLAALAADWFFVPPVHRIASTRLELTTMLLYVVGATPVAVLCGLFREVLLKMRRTNEQLAESEGRCRSLTDAMPHLWWTAHANGTLEYMNAGSTGIAGLEHLPDGS